MFADIIGVMNTSFTRRILTDLVPHMWTINFMTDEQIINAIVRMCIAHTLNGGAYTDPITTAREYLQSIGE